MEKENIGLYVQGRSNLYIWSHAVIINFFMQDAVGWYSATIENHLGRFYHLEQEFTSRQIPAH